jgi:RNA polymerase sigma factor (sigma-70 family)
MRFARSPVEIDMKSEQVYGMAHQTIRWITNSSVRRRHVAVPTRNSSSETKLLSREHSTGLGADIAEGPIAVEADKIDQVLDRVFVEEALAKLSPEHRQILEYVYLEDKSLSEAAEKIGIPGGTAKSRVWYALRAIREVLPSRPEDIEAL